MSRQHENGVLGSPEVTGFSDIYFRASAFIYVGNIIREKSELSPFVPLPNLGIQLIILGIDPGSNITGFGIIEIIDGKPRYISSGCIKLSKFKLQDRLSNIYVSILNIISLYGPTIVAIEDVYFSKNIKSTIKLSQARGSAIAAIGSAMLPMKEYAPTQVKKYSSGFGGNDKEAVKAMVKSILSLDGNPQSDASDALGVALCCWFKDGGV